MAKILLVEDDLVTASLVRDWLEGERYTVDEAHTGGEAREFIRSYDYDVIVLDWMLPELQGVELLREYRSLGGQTPVLMLTGKSAINEKETGLDAGADDYLTKPFDMRELSARVRALLRRPTSVKENVMRFGDLQLDRAKCCVHRGEELLDLLPTEYALLEFFMRNPGKVFSAMSLLSHVWKADSDATENGVRTYITRLRKKIDQANKASHIVNVYGLGYKFEPEPELEPGKTE